MAGIGDYEEGKPFTLKSGNKPTFKTMGSDSPLDAGLKHFTTNERPRTNSPNNLKDFGVGEGTSPYKQSVKSHAGDPYEYRKNDAGEWEYKDTRKEGAGWTVQTNQKGIDDIEKKYGSQITDTETEDNTKTNGTKTDGTKTNGGGNEEETAVEEKEKGGGLGGVLVGALTGGLDAVYGSGKILPPSSARLTKEKAEKQTKTGAELVEEYLAKNKPSQPKPNPSSTFNMDPNRLKE